MVVARPAISRIMHDSQKIAQGIMAINKPVGISSAQVIRDMQKQFDHSRLFEASVRQSRSAQIDRRRGQRGKMRNRGTPSVKMGHGGTLDVAARGVLVIGIGNGTKELSKFLECTKTYETVVLFGVATDTYDHVGKIVARKDFTHITEAMVQKALESFRGRIMQKPPIFSALRIQGKRLFEFAREGKAPPVEIKERPVEVLKLEMLEWLEGGKHEYCWPDIEAEKEEADVAKKLLQLSENSGDSKQEPPSSELHNLEDLKRKRDDHEDGLVTKVDRDSKKARDSSPALMSGALAHSNNEESATTPILTTCDAISQKSRNHAPAAKIRMTVTSGFYVRSFCHDLGEKVGSVAIMSDLVRTRQSDFELGKNVFEYDDLEKGEEIWGPQIDTMLQKWENKVAD